MIATMTGLIFMAVFGATWWSMALAVGTAVALMLVLRVPHPPAGSNPFIVMLGGVGWQFLFTPTLLGSLILVIVAIIYNNWGKTDIILFIGGKIKAGLEDYKSRMVVVDMYLT